MDGFLGGFQLLLRLQEYGIELAPSLGRGLLLVVGGSEQRVSAERHPGYDFDILGYTFGPHCFKKDGWWYVGESPSKKSLARLRLKVADCLRRHSSAPWPEVRADLNMILRGWSNYFRYGTTLFAYRAVDNYVYHPVRHFLRRRHKVGSRGGTQFPGTFYLGNSVCAASAATTGTNPIADC